MKKFFTLAMMSAFALGAMAQSNGFYHVQNTLTKRYMVLVDNHGKADTSGNVDMEACKTCLDLDEVSIHPGSVFYIQNISGTAYNVAAQGSDLAALTSNRLQVQITSGSEGYEFWGSYSGITVFIGDAENKKPRTDDEYQTWSYIKEAGSKNRYWKLLAIDNSTHYLGIKPDCQAAGAYWGTMKAGFSFKLYSSGMEAYYVDAVDNSSFSLKKWDKDVIPATMPVIIKCSSSDPAKNIIRPVTDSGTEPSTNYLEGSFFDSGETNHVSHVAYDATTMRTLGEDGGKLVFKKASSSDLTDGAYCVHNKAYLMNVPSSASSTLVEGSGTGIVSAKQEIKKADNAIYTLNGVKLQQGVTPRPGVYIQNGKKIVIK
ncbi:MAG: hypothetical protein IJL82_04345 [Prevotella sp.]|nr:hypothetical protein [Prevotella sp.]